MDISCRTCEIKSRPPGMNDREPGRAWATTERTLVAGFYEWESLEKGGGGGDEVDAESLRGRVRGVETLSGYSTGVSIQFL